MYFLFDLKLLGVNLRITIVRGPCRFLLLFLMLIWLLKPLQLLGEGIGLSPWLTLLVIVTLVSGATVQWQFQHHKHAHDDHDE